MVDNEERSNAGAVFRTGLKLILAVSIPSLIFGLTLSPFLSEVVLDGISLNTLIVVFLADLLFRFESTNNRNKSTAKIEQKLCCV